MKHLLFSIPIYNTTPKQFQKKVKKHHKEFKKNSLIDKEHLDHFYSIRYGKKTLRENYIIGFLNVNYNCRCLDYDILLCTTEKYDKPSEIEANIANINRNIVNDEEYKKWYIVIEIIKHIYPIQCRCLQRKSIISQKKL